MIPSGHIPPVLFSLDSKIVDPPGLPFSRTSRQARAVMKLHGFPWDYASVEDVTALISKLTSVKAMMADDKFDPKDPEHEPE